MSGPLRFNIFTLLSCLLASVSLANPIPAPIDLNNLASNADGQANVLLTAVTYSIVAWVPPDGSWYSASNVNCFEPFSGTTLPCGRDSLVQFAALPGWNCGFRGLFGATLQQSAGPQSGYLSVGPPQPVAELRCSPQS